MFKGLKGLNILSTKKDEGKKSGPSDSLGVRSSEEDISVSSWVDVDGILELSDPVIRFCDAGPTARRCARRGRPVMQQ